MEDRGENCGSISDFVKKKKNILHVHFCTVSTSIFSSGLLVDRTLKFGLVCPKEVINRHVHKSRMRDH